MVGRRYHDRGGGAAAVKKSRTAAAASTGEASGATLVWGLSRRQTAILAAILLAAIAVYLPSLRNGWVFDDWDKFVNNKLHS